MTPTATINFQSVAFTHTARSGSDMFLENYFADVTDMLQTSLTNASTGDVVVPFTYGSEMRGLVLTVIFNDSTWDDGTVIMQFGHADFDGDETTVTFPALTTAPNEVLLSLGIGWSLQAVPYTSNTEGYNTVKVKTSSNSTPQTLSDYAGGHDDGQLMTVGGYGDSTANPSGSWVDYTSDDELYDLASYMSIGDTSLTLVTNNPSDNDTIFQAVLQFDGLLVDQSVTFDANGGTGTMANQLATTATALNPSTLQKSGYLFDGWNTQADDSGTDYADGAIYPFSSSETLYAQWRLPPPAYAGPLLQEFSSKTLDVCTPKSITITGTRLSGVTASVQGKPVTVLENTATKLVLAFPAGLTPAQDVDLVINSSSGTLTHQDAFDIPADTCETELSKGRWTQLQSDGQTVKMYAKDPIGDGKIQFFVDGEEIAWVNAADEADPKLSFASSYPYLVRSVELKPGKNRFEIKLDGVRVWRATYVPKG